MPKQPPTEHDVVICRAAPADAEMAAAISAYLRRGGFHVIAGDEPAAADAQASRLPLVESAPDFVLIVTPDTVAAASDTGDAVYAEIARALAAGRNIVRVSRAGEPVPPVAGLPPPLGELAGQQSVTYDPDRLAESLSILQHSLSSDSTVNDRHLMRRTKRWFQFAGLFVLAGFLAQTLPPLVKQWTRPKPLPPVAPFALYWAGFGERAEGGAAASFALEPGAAVAVGDRVRIAFSPSADGYAYVVGKDSRGRVFVLFPPAAIMGGSRVRAGQTYHAPVESDWLTVDPQSGLDALYVFAGYDPLQNLEELVEEPETPATIGARRELVEQTVAGLLDGRHYQLGTRAWTRTTQSVDQSLRPGAGPATFTVALAGGGHSSRPATVEAGLLSAFAEITMSVAGAPRDGVGKR